jgi:hypothetical protein
LHFPVTCNSPCTPPLVSLFIVCISPHYHYIFIIINSIIIIIMLFNSTKLSSLLFSSIYISRISSLFLPPSLVPNYDLVASSACFSSIDVSLSVCNFGFFNSDLWPFEDNIWSSSLLSTGVLGLRGSVKMRKVDYLLYIYMSGSISIMTYTTKHIFCSTSPRYNCVLSVQWTFSDRIWDDIWALKFIHTWRLKRRYEELLQRYQAINSQYKSLSYM